MMLATYQTLCPKVYGFLFKKRQAEIILFLRLPGQDEKSLRKYLEWCKGDMDVLKDITAQLFTEISRWHNQGVANLGITLGTVYVCQDNFTSVVWGDLSCPKFRGCEGFDNGKFRDVDNARNLIMSYLERIHLRSPLYCALQTPNNSATRIAWNILGLKITQEISYNQVTGWERIRRSRRPGRLCLRI
ncbi:uncharacterized protein LOC135480190 isoform X2 [Liolophura sinensis]|uniref:uncharacterized protein LOC135480190 isoform X2 n=1 Tax=Liolophura sinensis TaxID=3198878 RepID=UPI00315862C5